DSNSRKSKARQRELDRNVDGLLAQLSAVLVAPRRELSRRLAAVGARAPLFGGELSRGLAELGKVEQRIVAEARTSARFIDDRSFTGAARLEEHMARGVSETERARKPRRACDRSPHPKLVHEFLSVLRVALLTTRA